MVNAGSRGLLRDLANNTEAGQRPRCPCGGGQHQWGRAPELGLAMTSPDLGANNGGGGLGAPNVGATRARGGEACGSRGEVEAPGSGDRMDDGDGDSAGRRTEERASLGGRAGAGRGCRGGERARARGCGGGRRLARGGEGSREEWLRPASEKRSTREGDGDRAAGLSGGAREEEIVRRGRLVRWA